MSRLTSKDKLIEATIEAVYESGLHSVTTAKIAQKAGLSEAMIYKHFGNKDEMITDTFMWIKQRLNKSVTRRWYLEEDFDRKKHHIWYGNVEFLTQHPKMLMYIIHFEHSKYMTDEIRNACLNIITDITDFFADSVDKGLLKPMPIELAIALFFSPILTLSEAIVSRRLEHTEPILTLAFNSTMAALEQ